LIKSDYESANREIVFRGECSFDCIPVVLFPINAHRIDLLDRRKRTCNLE